MGMSAFYGTASKDDDAKAVIDRALELGVTLLDTSDIYGPFTNEELVGKAIQGKRDKYVIATKCGIVMKNGQMAFDGSRQHVREACEASLKRLGIDCIDLYYLHRVDPNTPVDETFAEFKALMAEGKIKHAGISEAGPEDIRKAHAACPLTAVQLEWSLWSRDSEEDLVPVCRELGIGIVAYSPLGRGFLTGAIKSRDDFEPGDFRLTNPRFAEGAFEKNLELVEKVKDIAARKGVSAAQLALAWVHAQGDDVFPIPGTRSVKRLEENVGGAHVKLTKEDLEEIEAACPHTAVEGERYAGMKNMSYHYSKE